RPPRPCRRDGLAPGGVRGRRRPVRGAGRAHGGVARDHGRALAGRRGALRRTPPSAPARPHRPRGGAAAAAADLERGQLGAGARPRRAPGGDGWHAIDLAPDELAPRVAALRARLAAAGRPAAAVAVTLRKGVLVRDGATGRPLYGDHATIRRDLAAYRAAGRDYLVAGLRQAPSADALERALRETAEALGG